MALNYSGFAETALPKSERPTRVLTPRAGLSEFSWRQAALICCDLRGYGMRNTSIMPQRVRKAVFPAAGLGTRFLPATKASPKEMLPLVDKPLIQYVVEEAVTSGIASVIIVTGRGKSAIEDHFDVSFELEAVLRESARKTTCVWCVRFQTWCASAMCASARRSAWAMRFCKRATSSVMIRLRCC